METSILILAVLIAGIVLGAVLYAKFHTVLAEKFSADKAAVVAEYQILLARAHAERDQLFTIVHPPQPPLVTITTSATSAGSAAPLPPGNTMISSQPTS